MFRINTTLLTLVLAALVCMAAGCQEYGEVSPKAYQVATALYSICNRQDEPRLQKIEEVISQGADANELSVSEEEWLLAIVERARAGQWEFAMQDARTMIAEQVH